MSDDELESVLRRALAERADRVEPGPDGLRRIRGRIRARGGRRARWRAPAIALAGTAALLAAVFVAPAVLPALDDDGPGTAIGDRPTATASPTGDSGTAPAPTDTPVPGAGVNDLVTIWPYASRAEGYARAEQDVAAGTYPDLTQPDVTAVTFVESYVGAAQGLTAEPAGRWKAGLRMRVSRDGTLVSLVYLARVRIGNDAPYVVVDATSPALTLNAGPGLDGLVTVGGLRTDPDARPLVDMRPPGAAGPLVTARARAGGGEWGVELVPPAPRPRTRTDAVAAWTLDDGGRVTAFAADSAAG
jgi:hypothetical protein